MSVMLRCAACGNEMEVPDAVAAGMVTCTVCHEKFDGPSAVFHPRLDDLDPDLLLAPDDDLLGGGTATGPSLSSLSPSSAGASDSDDFLNLLESGPTESSDNDLDYLSDDSSSEAGELPTTEEPAVTSLSGPTPGVRPPDDDDDGYAIIEEDYGAKPAEAPSWLNDTADDAPSSEADDISVAEEKPAAKPVKAATKVASAAPAVREAFDDLLDDEIRIAPEEKPPVPDTPAECPECRAALKPGSIMCVACGFNLKTGKKMDAAPEAKGKGKGGKPAKPKKAKADGEGGTDWKAKLKDPRVMIGAGGGLAVLLLAIMGYLFFGGEDPPPIAAAPTTPTPPGPVAPGMPGAPTTPGTPTEGAPDGVAPVAADPTSAALILAPAGASGKASSFAFSSDGKLLAAGDESGSATIWDLEKGESKPAIRTGTTGAVQVAFDPESKQLLTGYSGGAKLWELAGATETRSFKTPVDGVWAARFAADGKSLFTSGPTGIFSTVDLSAGGKTKATKVDLPPGVYPSVDFTPDGKTGIVGADDGLLAVWDLAAGRPLKVLEGHTTRVAAVAISPDGKQAISAAGGPEYRTIDKERFLMGSRPTDFTVRFWDLGSGKETFRMHTAPEKPVTCVAFSPNGKLALIVAGDVQLIDPEKRELLATISPTPAGSAPAAAPGVIAPPTEPFRLAQFSPDGKRVVTGTQTSGVHLWQLPSEPKSKPLPGVADPPDLASFKPATWEPIRPLLIPATAAPDDKAMAERLAVASRAAEVSAQSNPTIKALRKALASKPRTAEALLKMAKLCRSKQLYLEAEECLRASLMADPTSEEARKEYEELKLIGPKGVGPVSITRAWVKEVPDLDDAGLRPDPPKGTNLVSVPIEVAIVDKATKVDSSTLAGKTDQGEATFLGIYHRPTGEITGAKKTPGGSVPGTGQAQVWEAMAVGKDKSGKTIVQLANRKIPQQEQARGKQTASGTPKIKLVPDTSKVKEDYKGPYEALFAVPDGATLSELIWNETTPVRVLGEEPRSLDKLVLDDSADTAQRLAAIEALGVSPTADAADVLEKVLAEGDKKLFDTVRAAMRGVRRQGNLISPDYLPIPDEKQARLMSITYGKIDGAGMPQPQQPGIALPSASTTPMTVHSSYNYCKTIWNLTDAGKYLARIAVFGMAPDYTKQATLEFTFTAAGPNLYVVQTKTDRDLVGEAQLVELWRDNKLVERRILSASPWAASKLAARLPLEPPVKLKGDDDDEESSPKLGGSFPGANLGVMQTGPNAPMTNVFPGTPVVAEAAPLLGGKSKLLPPVERAVLEELVAQLDASDQAKIPAAIVEVARLDSANGPMTVEALAWLKQLPEKASTPLFVRLAEVSSPPTALAAIEALHVAGEKSAIACRKLIDLQKGPAELQKPAEEAVNDLMTQGVIAQEGDNWRYHRETHFPEKPKAEPKAEAPAEPAE